MSDDVTVHHGDALDVLATMPDASVDAVVTDPPYGLEFMGKAWDSFSADAVSSSWDTRGRTMTGAPQRDPESPGGRSAAKIHISDNPRCRNCGRAINGRDTVKGFKVCQCETPDIYAPSTSARKYQAWCEAWAVECLRLLKPGGHLLAFGGSRTFHRLTCAIEDAGFEIRDCLSWLYGAGFPKSLSPYRSTMKALCPSHELAPHAVRISPWHPVESPEAKAPIALALAETQPEGDLVLLIRTGAADDSSAVMGTWLSDCLTDGTNWNTVSSWPGYSADRWAPVSTSIIETASRTTTVQRIWNSSRSTITRHGMPLAASPLDGCSCPAVTVAGSLNGDGTKLSAILIPTATAPVIAPLAPLRGLGTAAKPAWEPIIVARKPPAGTVAANVLAHGTGALNIDGTRVETSDKLGGGHSSKGQQMSDGWRRPWMDDPEAIEANAARSRDAVAKAEELGRWPANVVLDEDAAAQLDRQSGTSESRIGKPRGAAAGNGWGMTATGSEYADTGGASRFYYTAKAAPDERPRVNGIAHPTVKALSLMRWLVRLVTPPGGTVLDPFAGSGTTGEACLIEGFRCVLIEREADYLPLIQARLSKPIQPVLEVPA